MEQFDVFVSGQQTALAFDLLKGYLASKKIPVDQSHVDASCPKFNLRDQPNWITFPFLRQDCAVFGPNIQAAAVKFLKTLDPKVMKDFQPFISLNWKVDTFVQQKLKSNKDPKKDKLSPLINLLNSMELKEAADHIMEFAQRFQEVKMAEDADWSDWLRFIDDCKIPKNWVNSTHFDHILQLFGVPQDQVQAILNRTITESRGLSDSVTEEDGKNVTLRDYSVRWLSKALCGFSCSIVTDVVNLLASMSGLCSLKTEEEVVKMIESFGSLKDRKSSLHGRETREYKRCPEALLLDLEKDDLFSWWVVQSVRPPQVLVQLPQGKLYDELETLCKNFGENVVVFRDSDSTNGGALKNLFNLR